MTTLTVLPKNIVANSSERFFQTVIEEQECDSESKYENKGDGQ